MTGFVGPNGAGKSTTMRLVLGLDVADTGSATIAGQTYASLPAPARSVGALLEVPAMHPGRTARAHLNVLAAAGRLPRRRVDEVLGIVGLADAANRRIRKFSLGMRQRLGIAAALLGDPEVFILDEPTNGLDPEGVLWIRTLMKSLAGEGRTVFVSSHLMSELEQIVDDLIVITRGRIVAKGSLDELIADHAAPSIRVSSPDSGRLAAAVAVAGGHCRDVTADVVEITGLDAATVADLVAAHGIRVLELAPTRISLEEVFIRLTGGDREHQAIASVDSAGRAS